MMIAYSAERSGKAVILKASDGRELLITDWFDLVTELLVACDMAVVWNLDAFVDTVSVLFPKDVSQKLNEGGRAFLVNHEKLYFQPGRMFAVTYANKEVSFYGLSRYADVQPDGVSELLALGRNVVKAYGELGINATKLTSPVALFSLSKVPYPRACDLPDTALDMINACYQTQSREWREVYKLGHWQAGEVSDFDIQAAYPSLMAGLPDISKARFFTATEIPEHFTWGEMTGQLTITKQISPFIHEASESYPIGTWQDSITTDQLWLLKRWGIGTFQVEKGYFLEVKAGAGLLARPFYKVMQELYEARNTANPIASTIAKAISVGIGGKLAQRYDDGKLGADFNSIYARMVTSRCMVKVADFVYRNGLNPIEILVDGVLAEGNGINLQSIKQMGVWRQNDESPFIVASLLYAWGLDKHPDSRYYPEVVADLKAHPLSPVTGDVDLNMLDYSRVFKDRPHNGGDLLTKKYNSEAVVLP